MPCLKFDRRRLQQVLMNLLSNACKFTNEGEIVVYANWRNDFAEQGAVMIEVTVVDDGIGIAPNDLEEIFKPFRMQNARGVKGNGVGLSISKQICEQMGGSIEVLSKPDEGSAFTFTMRAYVDEGEIQENLEVNNNQVNWLGSLESYIASDSNHSQEEGVNPEQQSNRQEPSSMTEVEEATKAYTVKFQKNIIEVNYERSEVFKLSKGLRFDQYKDFSSLLAFLNTNSEFLSRPNKKGLIMLADDQFVI